MRTVATAVIIFAGIGLLVLAAAVNRPLPALGSAFAGLTLIATVLDRRP